MTDIQHVHTSTCWEQTHDLQCAAYRILELENMLLKLQAGLRATGGQLDKLETLVTMELKHPAPKEV